MVADVEEACNALLERAAQRLATARAAAAGEDWEGVSPTLTSEGFQACPYAGGLSSLQPSFRRSSLTGLVSLLMRSSSFFDRCSCVARHALSTDGGLAWA
ncbi:MAG: hypothetical protein QOI86_3575 [Actinomycetota bacterium]|jgi:hypothetical protein|nr:hypothetical protein [Actinomycetota bacterium]